MTNQHRFIILGTGGTFTTNVIQKLIEQNYIPQVYIQSGNEPGQNKITFSNIELEVNKPLSNFSQLIQSKNIPVYYNSQIELAALIQQFDVEFLLVACWPELLSQDVLISVSNAALNLHPSLLPKFRGIDPVGDQLKSKDNIFGISLHLLNDSFDRGDIVLQQTLNFNQTPNKKEIEIEAANKGANLFIQALNTFKTPGWKLIKQKS